MSAAAVSLSALLIAEVLPFFVMSCMNIEQRTNLVAAFFFFFVVCLLKGCCRVKVCLQVFAYFQSSCVLPLIATA